MTRSDVPYSPPLFEIGDSGQPPVPPLAPPYGGPWVPPERPDRPALRRFRRHLAPKTLAGRLTLGVVTLLVLVVVITGASTYVLLRPFLRNRVDVQLNAIGTSTSQSVTNQLRYRLPNGQVSLPPLGTDHEWIQIVANGAQIAVTEGSSGVQILHLSAADVSRVIQNANGNNMSVETTDGVSLRVTSRQIPSGYFGGPTYVVVGLSYDEVQTTLRRLLLLELLIGAAAVVVAAGLTTWGVRAGLRPLKRVTRTAQEVTAELGPDGSGLDRRVPGPEDWTEVGQVASSVNTLLATVETEFNARVDSEERMRQFLADASHELRTPLTSIRGYAELARLQGRVSDPDDPMRRIEVEGTRMSRLVEDLLVLARGDRDELTEHEPVPVDAILGDAASTARAAHPERSISLRPSGGAVVVGDRDQLVRLVVNLLNNACVHTDPSGAIWLEGVPARTATDAPAVAIRIIDSGPGLGPEEAAHVFERFWRADKARTRAKGGSGLGMAIVAQIAHSHGGQVHFDSSVESGTTVTVTLPVLIPDTPLTGTPGAGAGARQN